MGHCVNFSALNDTSAVAYYFWKFSKIKLNIPDFPQQGPCIIPWEISKIKDTLSPNVRVNREKYLDLSLYLDPHQKVMGSILDWDTSSIQVLWKTVQ